jgi:hypothetical protein
MAGMWDRIDRWERVLRRSQRGRSRYNRSSRSSGPDTLSIGPNAPRMITVIASIALAIAGLVVTGTVDIGFVSDLLAKTGVDFTREHGYWMLLGSPVLLIIGSLFPGI